MLIVNDIHDTITMKNKLSGLLRRSNTFGMSRHDIQIELDMIITDLMINEARIEQEMQAECNMQEAA